jgi:acetyl-CoA carboxylase carboxyltransferase component
VKSTLASPATEPAERLSPRDRLEHLCDEDSFRPLRSAVLSRRSGGSARPGDGVIAGAGRVGGRPVFCYCQDPSFLGGSLGEAHAETIVRTMVQAGEAGAPVVGFIESGGARLQEGHHALAGYGRIFRASVRLAGRIPQISIIGGVSAGGGAYSPALTDFVIMTRDARLFLTGPRVVAEAVGERVSMEQLGGPRVHASNGVAQIVTETEEDAVDRARELLGLLPGAIGERPPAGPSLEPEIGDPGVTVPGNPRRVYDVRETVRAIVDRSSMIEVYARWGTGIFTGLARLNGRPIAVVANQPHRFGGVIDAEAAEKTAVFVNDCNRFGLPLAVLTDTPGFMPGLGQERAGVIRHGASLLRAFAAARVPKATVIIRKAYGGAAITMNSRDLGADAVFAWPGAEIGIMSAGQAVGIVHRRSLDDAAPGQRERLVDEYSEEHLTAAAAAANGYVDEVIEPSATRASLDWVFSTLEDRSRELSGKSP